MTKIVEKYFTQADFSKREKEVLQTVCKNTGFIPQKVIFKGVIFDKDKVGSIIYKGKYKGRSAILKLQGLKPEMDEPEILIAFKKQNKSKIVRLPGLYEYKNWNEEDGYGFLITEFINYPKIYKMPFATDKQMQLFCDFYEEYKTKCLNKPFTKQEEEDESAADFVVRRVNTWKKISDHKGLLKEIIPQNAIDDIVNTYKDFMSKNLEGNLVFCHGHLSSKDIFYNGKEFILLSNLYWTWRPEFYDLIFGLHWCLESLVDENLSFQQYLSFVKKWLSYFYKIPSVAEEKDSKKKINLMLLERTMGAILIDTLEKKDPKLATYNLLNLQFKFFDHLIKNINHI
ncbi:MAG: hypothetical protein M1405_02610 [Patescibacteria group bacterium]|nr:hypothetical protein [Patescibacteria group bacterium]